MKLLLVGCGHMGQALLACFEKNPHIQTIHIVDPAYVSDHIIFRSMDAVQGSYDVVVLAIKPQVYKDMSGFSQVLNTEGCLLSVMAGIPYEQLCTDFKQGTVVRLMPNMGVAYGQGLTTAYTTKDRSMAEKVLINTGQVLWVEAQNHLDVLTIFNGCGPGLLLAITQKFVECCIKQGFSQETSEKIMRQVFLGTAAMLSHSEEHIESLVACVATKGGITEACLNTLAPQLSTLLDDTIYSGLEKLKTC